MSCTYVFCKHVLKTSAHLCIGDPVDRSLQSFVRVALDNTFDEAAPPPQGLLHAHAQVVVGFLRCQILHLKHTVTLICASGSAGLLLS